MMRLLKWRSVLMLLLASTAVCAESDWSRFSKQFLDAYFIAHPDIRLAQGDPIERGSEQLCSRRFLINEAAWWRAQLKQAQQFTNKPISPAERFDQARLIAYGQGQLFLFENAARHTLDHWAATLDPQRWLDTLQAQPANSIPIYLGFLARQKACSGQLQSTLQLPLSEADREWAHTLLSYYHSATMIDAPKAYAAFSRADRRQLGEASKQAADALLQLDNRIQRQQAVEPIQRLGEKGLLAYLQQRENLTVSLRKLREIANAEQQRVQQQLQQLCARFAADYSLQECVELARETRATAGVIELAQVLVAAARHTIEQGQLITMPAGAEVTVGKGTSYRRDWLVHLHQPGLFSSQRGAQLMVTAPAMDWSETERREHWRHRTTLPITVAHEVWPGHYLQTLHALQQPSPLGMVLHWTSHYEGWACYSESILFEQGNEYGGLGDQIIQRQLSMVRVQRLHALIGLHAESWSRSHAEQRYRDIALLTPASASQESLRSAVSPSAGMYALGEWYITQLRDAWIAAQAGRSRREFHDQFLAYGAAPLPLIANEMLGEQGAATLLAE